MNNFPTNEIIQENSCFALRKFTETNKKKSIQFENLNGIDLILKTMINFPNNQQIQFQSFSIFINIGKEKENQNKIKELFGIEIIILSIIKFEKDKNLKKQGFKALSNLGLKNKEIQNQIKTKKELKIEDFRKIEKKDVPKDSDYILLKIILLGGDNIGKTQIVNRFVNNSFRVDSAPTIGIDYEEIFLEVNGKIIILQIWDTPSQERKVSKEEAQKFADKIGIPFIETSAKENINIDEAFFLLIKMILQNPNFYEKLLNSKLEKI
ncbi:small rab-related gtpase [Anaeramoeba ignava]|uniref:Small rab-related gtpase n=1 Tax=Anaeramoeba ignava TaxID=1746090 RepID=A0A9Q0LEF2_ANAIG|nr:small rab-related gtpase [Anaeramoeba ignava]